MTVDNTNTKLLFKYRFEFFLITLVFSLFGILLFNDDFFTTYLFPIALLSNIATGINLISNKRTKIFITVLFIATALFSGFSMVSRGSLNFELLRLSFYFLFYIIITYEVVKQIWFIREMSKDLIIGVICGYITLGLVGFFIFMAVEMAYPGSFSSSLFTDEITITQKTDSLLYYSYITLMAIGYGEIVPITTEAQKAAVLLGLLGQFYLVIITGVVVGKYINYASK